MSKPKISIVMAVFNRPEMVKVMIDSITANDCQDWELIAVDDGSDNETIELLSEYKSTDSRIRLIHRDQEPKGPLTCRNIGLKEANSEYIVFFDSDDYITPCCLSSRIAAMEYHKDLDFMIFPSGEYTDGRIDEHSMVYAYGYPIHTDDIASFARRILPFVVVNNIYRRSSLEKNGIWWDTELKSLEDADFNMQCLLSGMKYQYARALPDYGYRITSNTQSLSKKMYLHYDSHIHALEKFYTIIQEKFGHEYDSALFEGLMSIFTMVCREQIDQQFIYRLKSLLKKYDSKRGKLLNIQVWVMNWLKFILPKQKARQIATAYYVAKYRYLLKRQKPHQISNMIIQYEKNFYHNSNI